MASTKSFRSESVSEIEISKLMVDRSQVGLGSSRSVCLQRHRRQIIANCRPRRAAGGQGGRRRLRLNSWRCGPHRCSDHHGRRRKAQMNAAIASVCMAWTVFCRHSRKNRLPQSDRSRPAQMERLQPAAAWRRAFAPAKGRNRPGSDGQPPKMPAAKRPLAACPVGANDRARKPEPGVSGVRLYGSQLAQPNTVKFF